MKTKQSLIKCLTIASTAILASHSHAESEHLVYAIKGTIPVLITAPHGGNDQPGNVAIRTGVDSAGKIIEDFNIVKDSWTKAIAKEMQRKYQEKYGGVPYIVAADFHRKYIDANRPEHQAFESEEARFYYDAYHNKIGEFISDIQQKFSEGILLDIHGQAQHPNKIIRGTRNGFAVENLINNYGWDAIVGQQGIFGLLEQQGFSLEPTNYDIPTLSAPMPESSLSGGATIKFNGSHNAFGIDAIQFEIGSDIRFSAAERDLFTDNMADNIHTFIKNFYCEGNRINYPCSPKAVIVDYDYQGYKESNDWQSSSAIDNYPYKKLSQSRYTDKAGESVSWRNQVKQSGKYHIYAWWGNTKSSGAKYNRDSSAEYNISTATSNFTVVKNQNNAGGEWVLLTTVSAMQGDDIVVELTREDDGEAGAATIADAMAFTWAEL